VLATLMLSALACHRRYAHITAMSCDSFNPSLLGIAVFRINRESLSNSNLD